MDPVVDIHCPDDGTKLDVAGGSFQCSACETRFPVVGGVPILLEAEELETYAWKQLHQLLIQKRNFKDLKKHFTARDFAARFGFELALLEEMNDSAIDALKGSSLSLPEEATLPTLDYGNNLVLYLVYQYKAAWQTANLYADTTRICLEGLAGTTPRPDHVSWVGGSNFGRTIQDLEVTGGKIVAIDASFLSIFATHRFLEAPAKYGRIIDAEAWTRLSGRVTAVVGSVLDPLFMQPSFDLSVSLWLYDLFGKEERLKYLSLVRAALKPGGRYFQCSLLPKKWMPKAPISVEADEVFAELEACGLRREQDAFTDYLCDGALLTGMVFGGRTLSIVASAQADSEEDVRYRLAAGWHPVAGEGSYYVVDLARMNKLEIDPNGYELCVRLVDEALAEAEIVQAFAALEPATIKAFLREAVTAGFLRKVAAATAAR